MVDRKDIGSWLEGPPSAGGQRWPGQRLGRPERGPASIARVGPRVVALFIDWALCSLISYGFWGGNSWATMAIFLIEQILFISTLGYSIGHRIMGLQVQKMTGQPAGPLAAVVRSVLLCLVIPAVIFDADQRGLHDKAMGTVLVRIR